MDFHNGATKRSLKPANYFIGWKWFFVSILDYKSSLSCVHTSNKDFQRFNHVGMGIVIPKNLILMEHKLSNTKNAT